MLKTDPRALGKPGKPSTNQVTHPIPSIQLVVPWRMAKVRGRCEGTDSKWERDLRLCFQLTAGLSPKLCALSLASLPVVFLISKITQGDPPRPARPMLLFNDELALLIMISTWPQ